MAIRYEADLALSRKLGSRLAYLESLSRTDEGRRELAKRHAAESSELKALEGQIQQARQRLARLTAAQLEPERKKLERLYDRLFVPLTCGLHIPDAQGRTTAWPKGPKKPFVSAFLVLKDGPSGPCSAELERLGVQVRAGSRNILTALVPLAALREIAASIFVDSVELARPLFPNENFSSGDAVKLSGILARHLSGQKGDGVIVGVIDDGLDLAHPDFQTVDRAGVVHSRVLFLWQQDVDAPQGTATAPPALPAFAASPSTTYGVQYTQAEIDAWIAKTGTALFPEQPPPVTHGTLVAGCAAGNGRAFTDYVAKNGRPSTASATDLVGAAPNADIVFVARQGVNDASIVADATAACDAFAYVFERATELRKDCVVNLSQSDNLGPHDGTSVVETFLNGLLAGRSAGRTVTLSAGNSNRTGSHAFATANPGAPYVLPLRYSQAADGTFPTHSDTVEIWYPGAKRLSLTLTVPATTTTPATVIGPVPAPGTKTQVVGNVTVIIESFTPGARSTDNLIRVTIVLASGSIPLGDWNLSLDTTSSSGVDFHAWVDRCNRGYSGWIAPALREDDVTLANPSAAGETITVGSHDQSTPPVILSSSGCGLTRSGAAKPDLAAHGSWMYAPFPVHLAANAAYPYDWGGGTSVAAPLVAGSCAILFQVAPGSTHVQIKSDLLKLVGTLAPTQPAAFGKGFLKM